MLGCPCGAADWHLALGVGAQFPSPLLPRLWAQLHFGPAAPPLELPGSLSPCERWWVKGVLQRAGTSTGTREQGEGVWEIRLLWEVIESTSEIEAVFKWRACVILLHPVSLGVTGGCRTVENYQCWWETLPIWIADLETSVGGVSISSSQGFPLPAPGSSLKEQSSWRNACRCQIQIQTTQKTCYFSFSLS